MSFVPKKNYLLMRDIITKYHPDFVKSEDLRKYGLEHSHIFNCERLAEETIAAVGGYQFIDEAHKDFNCKHNSDLKTCSIGTYPTSSSKNSYRGEISGVSTAGGSLKSGALRCVIYNPHYETLMYYFLPKKFWQKSLTINRHPSSNIGRIFFSYNRKQNYIPSLQGYECKSFEDLALR